MRFYEKSIIHSIKFTLTISILIYIHTNIMYMYTYLRYYSNLDELFIKKKDEKNTR